MPDERGNASELEPRFYPNLIGRLYLISLEDVMGRNGVNALLNLAGTRHLVNNYPPSNLKREFPFADLTTISKSTETMYGPRGARGMELRAGRYAFNLGLKEFGPLLGMADLALKLMPIFSLIQDNSPMLHQPLQTISYAIGFGATTGRNSLNMRKDAVFPH